tara:strand:- start:1977 stop:2135 length:159 start_codon:yes stop_codon:yes gene_type:complete
MNKLTEKEMITIIKEKKIDKCSDHERSQVMAFAFGEEFVESNDKGARKTYKS